MPASKLNIDLFISTQCPHCAQALELLTKAVKQGSISGLTIVNLSSLHNPDSYRHIRSVPFIQIDDYEFAGEFNKAELDTWIQANQDGTFADIYFSTLLMDGKINQVEQFIQRKPGYWLELLKLIQNEETKMQVRIGVTAIFESIGSDLIKIPQCDLIISSLIQATKTQNHAIRVDLIYILSLIFTALETQQLTNSILKKFMESALTDPSIEIKEIAEDALN